jgi:hypothetical protein
MAWLPSTQMAAQGGALPMTESAVPRHARAPVTTLATRAAFVTLAAFVLSAMFVKAAVTFSKIVLGKMAAERAAAETRAHPAMHHPAKAATVATAATARASIDLSQSEPKHNHSADSESFSKKHPSGSCNPWTVFGLSPLAGTKSSARAIK